MSEKVESVSDLQIAVLAGDTLGQDERAEILALCSRAYQEDFTAYLRVLAGSWHITARQNGILVSHAAWVTRWLEVGGGPRLRTAYVEAVATEPDYEGRGYATAIMQRVAAEIQEFDIGALSPARYGLYERLGWEKWQGRLYGRDQTHALIPTPDEEVMILRLPKTPALDLTTPISIEWREGEVW